MRIIDVNIEDETADVLDGIALADGVTINDLVQAGVDLTVSRLLDKMLSDYTHVSDDEVKKLKVAMAAARVSKAAEIAAEGP